MAKKVIEAAKAVAIGAKLCEPDVIPLFPITPQTHIVEHLSDFVNNGEMNAELIHCESEHSAISACIGVSAAGSRVFTATSSQGLALMHEVLHIASGMRIPIVMANANRSLSAPINIWNDHQDAMAARDTGWIQLYVESSQEALDTTIQAFKIAEDKKVMLPVLVCLDGFGLSHVFEQVDIPSKEETAKFLPKFIPEHKLDPEKPVSFGPIAFPNSYMNFKEEQQKATLNSIKIIKQVHDDFAKAFKRKYGNGLIEEYNMEKAETGIICMGTIAGTARTVIDELNANVANTTITNTTNKKITGKKTAGKQENKKKETKEKNKKIGLVRIRCFRPFPEEELRKTLKNVKNIIILDRAVSFGNQGPVFTEVSAAINAANTANLKNIKGCIVGLGGRDVSQEVIIKAIDNAEKKGTDWIYP